MAFHVSAIEMVGCEPTRESAGMQLAIQQIEKAHLDVDPT